jgi:PIN domain nuclease of toxin-antitoxin system
LSVCLADACALIEFEFPGAGTMTPLGRDAMAGDEVHVLSTTVWEITRKVRLGKLALPVPSHFSGDYPDFLANEGYRQLTLDWQDAALAATLPDHHKDPMDRFLIAAALRRNWPVVTADPIFQAYGVRTLW